MSSRDSGSYTVSAARYAKGMFLVRTSGSNEGLKTRGDRLLGAIRARYTHRERGYVLSKSKLARFEELFRDGWDANFFSNDLIDPSGAAVPGKRRRGMHRGYS